MYVIKFQFYWGKRDRGSFFLWLKKKKQMKTLDLYQYKDRIIVVKRIKKSTSRFILVQQKITMYVQV